MATHLGEVSEYEILEKAFERAGRDLDEAKQAKQLLSDQLGGAERERDALAQRVRTLEALAAARHVDGAEQAARERNASSLLADRDAALAAHADDLRLERDIVLAVRQQVDAAENERIASTARIEVLRQRLTEKGGQADAAVGEAPTGEASWEALLHDQVSALEEGLAARDAELATLRAQLDGSRREVRRLRDDSPLVALREESAASDARLRGELAATQAELESRSAESAASSASAALMRARLSEQAQWIARRDDQLASVRRESDAMRDQYQALKAEVEGGTDRRGSGRAGGSGGGGGGVGAKADAEWAGKVASLQEQLAAAEGQLSDALATSSARLSEEAAQTQKVHGELQAANQALTASRAEATETGTALRLAESRCATLDGERRTKSLEVARLSSELGAMTARLQASKQEVRSTDGRMAASREVRAGAERELTRLRDESSFRDEMNTQLKSALARESERVAKAWEQREALRATLQTRDDTLERMRAELTAAKEGTVASNDELYHLREQRRLSEILLRGAEERSSLRQHAIASAKDESSKLSAEVAALQARLLSVQEVDLKAKEAALQRADEALHSAQLSTESRDERVALLTAELGARAEEVLTLRAALVQKEEEIAAVHEGTVRALQEQLDAATAEARLASVQRDDAFESLERLKKTLDRRTLEVGARAEQLRVSHESAMLLTLEATLKDERMQSLSESLEVERTRHEREAKLVSALRAEGDRSAKSVLELTKQLARERERGGLLELRLSQRDEQASTLIEDLRSAEARGDGKEVRMAILKQRAQVAAEERELFDHRLGELQSRMAAHENDLEMAREERGVLVTEAASAQAEAEARRAEAAALRTSVSEANARLSARDEQLAALNARLSAAREDLDVQLAMVQEEVRGAAIRMEAKDVSLELQIEEAIGREQQAQGFMSEVGERLRKAKDAMASKDELLATLQSKLHAAVASLREHEDSSFELRRNAASDRRARDEVVGQLTRLEERHELMRVDYDAANEALDNYRDSIVHAEVKMRQDRERVADLQQELREMHAAMARPTAGGVPAPLPALPALGSSAAGADVGSSRVHFLYFLSSFLLLKTALAREGQMANAHAQEVFEEIVRNEVPLEEWPTYIFTRVYAQRSQLHDSEIAALKAVAKRSEARKDLDEAAGKENAPGTAGAGGGNVSAADDTINVGKTMGGAGRSGPVKPARIINP